jgi:hypothetical protein
MMSAPRARARRRHGRRCVTGARMTKAKVHGLVTMEYTLMPFPSKLPPGWLASVLRAGAAVIALATAVAGWAGGRPSSPLPIEVVPSGPEVTAPPTQVLPPQSPSQMLNDNTIATVNELARSQADRARNGR